MTNDRLLDLNEVLKTVGLSRASIYRMIQAGTFPEPVKVGAASRWKHSAVQEWIGGL